MMNDERISELLKRADMTGGQPRWAGIGAAAIRRRIRRRRIAWGGVSTVVAGVLVIGGLCHRPDSRQPVGAQDQRIASLEEQIRQLKAQTEETLALVHDVLAKERQQDRLATLEAELASIPDPAEQMKQRDEKTAFTLVYQADRMYREMRQVESAVETYEQVIRLYPQNHWAEVARQRIVEIKKPRIRKSGIQGETKWQRQSETPSV